MKEKDTRVLERSCHELIHVILKKIRECEAVNIDVEEYIPKDDLREIILILDCCLDNKDISKIKRRG